MTADRVTDIINKTYGYDIIDEVCKAALSLESGVIISELGIGSIIEFLSYDISEFSEVRKTIHARRFYQMFKEPFGLKGFTMEAFHKIQAGCIFMVALSEVKRGLNEYNFTGFTKEALLQMQGQDESGSNATLNEKLYILKSMFEKFSRVSLGIYSLQIFTKYGMSIQKINKFQDTVPGILLNGIIKDMNAGKKSMESIKKLMNLNIIQPDELDNIIDDYIDFSIADIAVQSLTPRSRKTAKENKKLSDEIRDEVHDAFVGLKKDVMDLNELQNSIKAKLVIYNSEFDQPGIAVLFAALLDRYVTLIERLWFYEGNSFIKRINRIFIDRVRVMFKEQRRQEMKAVQNECIRLIEAGLPGVTVFELEGFLMGLNGKNEQFNILNGINPDESKQVIRELNEYMDSNLKIAGNIHGEIKENLQRLLGPEGIPDEEAKVLSEIVYNFDAVIDFLTEDEQ